MDTSKIEKNGKVYLLAYDQGFEHGPVDFINNDYNHDPEYIFKVGIEGGATCVTMQYGLVRNIYKGELKDKMPLILKLNGKSKLNSNNYISAVTGSVADAVKIGAAGIGFTIFPGQTDEHIQYEQFAKIRHEAEDNGLITILWSYARGPEISDQYSVETVGYAARIAAELGADFAKVKYTGSGETFKNVVKVAGSTKVLASGTDNFEGEYTEAIKDMMTSGASGVAVGRNIWQSKDPIQASKDLAGILLK